jgi:exodeoxyribonuclease VII large subunit
MEEAGLGALQQAFEALKSRLAAEGLFDSSRKKPLPAYPRQLGVITSPTGAAIRDILSILQRRYPALPVLIYPVPVQGAGAADAIAKALRQADQRKECDILIIARGGGSLEDLWAFNEEPVARAIAACEVPLVSGIGHEIDFTIADFAADHRAPTPSAAAELVSPDRHELLSALNQYRQALLKGLEARLERLRQRFVWLLGRLKQQHPKQQLQQQNQRLDDLERHLLQTMTIRLKTVAERLKTLESRLQQCSPAMSITKTQSHCSRLEQRLQSAMRERLTKKTHRLDKVLQALHTLSPQATLSRGYAIVTRKSDGAIIRESIDVDIGAQVFIQLAKDRLAARISDTSTEHSTTQSSDKV